MAISKISGVTWSDISKVNAVTASDISKVNGVNAPSDYFLDTYTGAKAAYSLRQLSSTATGAIVVENSSGGTATIGFDSNGDLDTAALASHCGSNYGRVSTWLDQSGNGNNMTQTTATSRPYIVDGSGNLITTTDNSIPALDFYFSSTARWLENTFVSNNGDHYVASLLAEFRTVTTGQQIISQWSGTQTQQVLQIVCRSNSLMRGACRYDTASNNLGRKDTTDTVSVNTEYIITSYMSASPYEGDIDFNGDKADTDTGFPTSGNIRNNSQLMAIGRRSDNGAAQFQGFLSEFVIWSDTTIPSQSDIMTDTNTHYSVF